MPSSRRRLFFAIPLLAVVALGLTLFFWPEKGRDTRYNEETVEVMRRVLRPDSNGVDVGAFEGTLTLPMMHLAPRGTHYAIEPQPAYARRLREKIPGVRVLEVALGEAEGRAAFTLALDDPAYSGFKAQAFPRPDEKTQTISVRVARLDDVVPPSTPIAFIKIDVEGAEFMVLRGAKATLLRDRPVVVFEYGNTGMKDYGTKPEMIWALLHNELGLELSLMRTWLDGGPPFTAESFSKMVWSGAEWMFIAYPARPKS